MFEHKIFTMDLAGRELSVEIGKIAELASGSAIIRYGETMVMVNVSKSAKPRDGIDFFPLSVDYEEKLYSVGKIPGSFQKREGKPSDKAILTSRAIDRPLRPLFPKDFRNDVVVVATVLSVEQDNSPEVAAMIGASAALSISDIPFGGPTAAVNVGLVDGKIVINPTEAQRKVSDLTLTVAGTEEKIAMIEAGANEVPDDVMLEAIKEGHKEIKKICKFIEKMKEEIGKPKFEYKSFAVNPDVYAYIEENFKEEMKEKVQEKDKETRDNNIAELTEKISNAYAEKYGELLKRWQIDKIIPVPMYDKKKQKRGYNQAEEFGNRLGFYTGIETDNKSLIRIKDTIPQKGLSNEQRKMNMSDAFAVDVEKISNYKNVLLVDDIYTTGSTIDACSKILIMAGVEKVYFVCIATGMDK